MNSGFTADFRATEELCSSLDHGPLVSEDFKSCGIDGEAAKSSVLRRAFGRWLVAEIDDAPRHNDYLAVVVDIAMSESAQLSSTHPCRYCDEDKIGVLRAPRIAGGNDQLLDILWFRDLGSTNRQWRRLGPLRWIRVPPTPAARLGHHRRDRGMNLPDRQSTMERVAEVHNFGKGMGLAAPQIGIDRAAAIVRPPTGDTITLLNPQIIEESTDSDEQYEGCLSFFDVRGMVPRPMTVTSSTKTSTVPPTSQDSTTVARLVGHEIDHLHGILY